MSSYPLNIVGYVLGLVPLVVPDVFGETLRLPPRDAGSGDRFDELRGRDALERHGVTGRARDRFRDVRVGHGARPGDVVSAVGMVLFGERDGGDIRNVTRIDDADSRVPGRRQQVTYGVPARIAQSLAAQPPRCVESRGFSPRGVKPSIAVGA